MPDNKILFKHDKFTITKLSNGAIDLSFPCEGSDSPPVGALVVAFAELVERVEELEKGMEIVKELYQTEFCDEFDWKRIEVMLTKVGGLK